MLTIRIERENLRKIILTALMEQDARTYHETGESIQDLAEDTISDILDSSE